MEINRKRATGIVAGALICGLAIGGGAAAFAANDDPGSSTSSALELSKLRMPDGRGFMEVTPEWPKNEFGLTVGQPTEADRRSGNIPDLTPRTTVDGKAGFIHTSDAYGPDPKSPEEAAAQSRENVNAKGEIHYTVYGSDGKTVIGTDFAGTVSQGTVND